MSGGAFECVAAYINNEEFVLTSYGKSLVSGSYCDNGESASVFYLGYEGGASGSARSFRPVLVTLWCDYQTYF